MPNKILDVRNITMQFGGVVAVDNLNMEINEHEIVSLIGPNGAGKTTAFNVITGVYKPTNGEILFQNHCIAAGHPTGKMKRMYQGQNAGKYAKKVSLSPDRITKLGMARTFQNIRLFKGMTVFDNVLVAKHLHRTSNIFSATFLINAREEIRARSETEQLLRLLDLWDVRNEMATNLPYGKQRHLEIARALATSPKLLLLDEPAAGMNPQETQELTHFIRHIRDEFQMTIFLIEHHMNLVMDISDRVYVIDFGKLIAHGTPSKVQSDQKVIDAYLGVSDIG